MASRQVVGLLWAEQTGWPQNIPRPRALKGTKGDGLRYERQVVKAIPGAMHNQWFKFCDMFGVGYCCPDIIVPIGRKLLILECKLSDKPEAIQQLMLLYQPVVERATGLETIGMVVTKVLRPWSERVVGSIKEGLEVAAGGLPPVVHWLGGTPLWDNDGRGGHR